MRLSISFALLVACDAKPDPVPTPSPLVAPAAAAIVDELEDARKKTAALDAMKVHQAVEIYMLRKRGECPAGVADLVASGELSAAPKDPWGGDYGIICEPGGRAAVVSAGPDRKQKSDDDIVHRTQE